jgi:predicted transcriptional regulator
MSFEGGVMARTPQDVTDAELAVLEVLWDQGTATIRQLTDTLYPAGTSAHYATVQKLLDRLESKAFVRRHRGVTAHTFAASVDRDELIGRRLEATAQRLCGGSLTPLLLHLVRARKLSARERQELRSLIDELDEKTRSKGERR